MKNTTYSQLYDSVFPKIKDFDLAEMEQNEAYGIIADYLRPAIVMFSGCTQNLSDRDDLLGEFNYHLNDENFEILSNYMAICYLDSNYIRTQSALKSALSSTDFHKYDNKDMLSKAIEVRSMYKKENDKLMIDYSYKSSNMFEQVIKRKNRGILS